MANISDKNAVLKQNLIDAGCDETTVNNCMCLAEQKKEKEMQFILKMHKKNLLDNIHAEQKQIDCLDFLMYQMEKGNII